jgi:hypothetical protein
VKPDCRAARSGKTRGDVNRPADATEMPQPLAHAFLALADDDAVTDQRTIPRALTAAVATVALAVGAPLGFLALNSADHPVATLATKVSLDDE